MANLTSDLLKDRIVKFNDTEYTWKSIGTRPFRHMNKAAILVPLFIKDCRIYVWLTERAKHLRHDGGHVAFPGGMKDSDDKDEAQTSLRESFEEIGLQEKDVQVICQLLPRVNRRLTLITPVVALVNPDFVPKINEEEVEAAFYLPLDRFLLSDNYTASTYENRGIHWIVHYFHDNFKGKKFTTWGLTAGLCVEVAICLYQQLPDFEWTKESKCTVEDPFYMQRLYLQRIEETMHRELLHSKV